MSIVQKLDMLELSIQGQRLPRELFKIIRDNLLKDYEKNAAINSLYHKLLSDSEVYLNTSLDYEYLELDLNKYTKLIEQNPKDLILIMEIQEWFNLLEKNFTHFNPDIYPVDYVDLMLTTGSVAWNILEYAAHMYFYYQNKSIITSNTSSYIENFIDNNNSFADNIFEISAYHGKPIALPIYDKDSTKNDIPVSDTFLEDLYYRYDKIKNINFNESLEIERYNEEKKDNFETPGIYNIIPDHIKKRYINTRYEKIGVSDLKFNIETYNRDRKEYLNLLDTSLAKKRYIIPSNYTGSHRSAPPEI